MKASEITVGRVYTNGRTFRCVLAVDDAGKVQVAEVQQGQPRTTTMRRWIGRTTLARWAVRDALWSQCCNVPYDIVGRTTLHARCPTCGESCDP
jgi:hypothetical protein